MKLRRFRRLTRTAPSPLPFDEGLRRRAAIVVAAGFLLAVVTSGDALAGHQTGAVTSYTGCLNPNGGTIYSLAPGNSPLKECFSGQPQVHLSGGDITAVTAGSGLTGGGTEGAVSLGVDTTQVQSRVSGGCEFPGAISEISEDGSVACSSGPLVIHRQFAGGDVSSDPTTIGSLPLPPGMWLIIAKVSVRIKLADVTQLFWNTDCSLEIHNESDRSHAGGDTDFEAGGTLTMMLTVETTDPDSADVKCTDNSSNVGVAEMTWEDLRITAIQLGDLLLP